MAKKEKKVKEKKEKVQKSADLNGDSSEKKGGGFIFAIVSLLASLLVIVAVLAGFLFVIVKFNALGVAETYRDSIAKVPLLNIALPQEEKTDPAEMTFSELMAVYDSKIAENEELKGDLDNANKRVEELSKAKSELDAQLMIDGEKTEQLMQQVLAYEANKKQLDDLKYDLDRIIAEGDTEAFAKYYEGVSPEVAQEIYAQIIQTQKSDDEKSKFIKLFQTLDTKASAQIIDTLGSARIDFITDTLGSLKKDVAAEIIANLTPELAAQVTLRLAGN
jgi:hypothetical protein